MRFGLLLVGSLMTAMGCSSSAQFSSASGGSGGKAGGGSAGSAGTSSGGSAGTSSGGSAGSGTAGSGAIDGGTAGGGPAIDAGSACHWGHPDPCGSGMFCNATGCGTGKCIPKLKNTSSDYNPVCGCDGVTYWNPSVAGYFGMAVATTGVCAALKSVGCSASKQCAPGLHCNNRRDQALCAVNSTAGVCWGLPEQCPVDGPKGQPCPTAGGPTFQCMSKCQLIQSETPWYLGTCG